MAKKFTQQIGSSRIRLDLYSEEICDAMQDNIRVNLVAVAKDMEAEAKALCPVGKVEKASPQYHKPSLTYWNYLTRDGRLDNKIRKHYHHVAAKKSKLGMMPKKKSYFIKYDHSVESRVDRAVGKKWESREPGRLRKSIRASVYLMKERPGVILFLEAGDENSFYASFVEFGTYKMRPRPFLRQAFARHYGAARRAIIDGMNMRKFA